MSERHYPITPRLALDPRFDFGLLHDVAQVLADHGYPPVTAGPDLVDLRVALYRFLYGPTEEDQ